jgi:hypothetical protein
MLNFGYAMDRRGSLIVQSPSKAAGA